MRRRDFLRLAPALPFALLSPARALGAGTPGSRVLVLLELNGGNDGLNTVIPYTDRHY